MIARRWMLAVIAMTAALASPVLAQTGDWNDEIVKRDPSPAVIAAVEGAVGWFKASAIHGMRLQAVTAPDGEPDLKVVAYPRAPPLWARFYDLETNRPIFPGRDSVVHYEVSQIERERRMGYRYYGDQPAALLRDDYPAWRRRIGLS